MKCKTCNQEVKEITETLTIGNVIFEKNTHDFDKCLKDIVIPKDWRLWTYQEAIENYNNHKKELNLQGCWFFIEQPFKENKEKGYVARLCANSDEAYLHCNRDPSIHSGSLGVRFAKDIKKVKNTKKGVSTGSAE
jgi:hypothetical protein